MCNFPGAVVEKQCVFTQIIGTKVTHWSLVRHFFLYTSCECIDHIKRECWWFTKSAKSIFDIFTLINTAHFDFVISSGTAYSLIARVLFKVWFT